jgi:hypothetical protein
MAEMKIGGHPVDLMVDMGAEHAVVTLQWALFPKGIQLLTGLHGTGSAAPS